MRDDFLRWEIDFKDGRVVPRNKNEEGFWPDNVTTGTAGLSNGFINGNIVPYMDSYSQAQLLGQAAYETTIRLNQTPGIPNIKKETIRVYKSWEAFVNQQKLNLSLLVKSFS